MYLRLTAILIIITASQLAHGQSQGWQAFPDVLDSPPRVFFPDSLSGDLYIGGGFKQAGQVTLNSIARYADGQFFPLGNGQDCSGTCLPVLAITRFQGDLYIGGSSMTFGGNQDILFRWDGTTWHPEGGVTSGQITRLKVIDGLLYAFGRFDSIAGIAANSLAVFDGSTWSDVHNFPNLSPPNLVPVNDIVFFNNEFYVGGIFVGSEGRSLLTKWDGTDWVDVGGGISGSWVNSLVVFQGELFAAGRFSQQSGAIGNNIQKWTGSAWRDVDSGVTAEIAGVNSQINDLIASNQFLYAIGAFGIAGGVPAKMFARFDGQQWCGLGIDFESQTVAISAWRDTLFVGGGFLHWNGDSAFQYSAMWVETTPDTCKYPVSITPVEDAVFLKVFPNPTNHLLHIQFPKTGHHQIKLYSLDGRLVECTTTRESKATLSVDHLPTGLYVLQVVNGNQMITRRINMVRP